MSELIYNCEDKDGVRCSWQYWPSNKQALASNVMPLAVFYTLHKNIEGMGLVEYDPVLCPKCKSVLNSQCAVDFKTKVWACQFCLSRNPFPAHYKAHITESTLPTELMPQYSTIEYIIPESQEIPPIFFFVVDTCCSVSELSSLKSSLQQSINLLPAESLVGLLSFGKNAFLYNLSYLECSRSVAFKGDKPIDPKYLTDYLSLGKDPKSLQNGAKKFIMPVSECEFALNMIIEELQKDPWPISSENRCLRCTGTALSIALTLLELAYNKKPARVLLFSSGAGTFGPGLVVSESLSDIIRTFRDVKEETAAHIKSAENFYEGLAQRASHNSHSVDIFCCSIDQIGLYEMRGLSTRTGGIMVLTDTYKSDVFTSTLQKVFNRDETGGLSMGFDSQITLLTSPGVSICGAIGPGFSLVQKVSNVSETEIGSGMTNTWRLGSFDTQTTIGYYFDLTVSEPSHNKGFAYVQFQVKYLHSSGRKRLRVTTVKYPYIDANDPIKMIQGFDQETTAVALARWAVYRTESEDTIDVVRWIDRQLIKFMKKFSEYRFDVAKSFRLHSTISLFPQFIFHLRRSQFLKNFNMSPDESAYYRLMLNRETITNCLLMIQPAILQYSFDSQQAEPVLLDIVSMKNNVILLLDSYFHVVIWRGEMIGKWIKLKYHEHEDYEHFRVLLKMPEDDAQIIVMQRFPSPKLVITESGKGQERLIKAKVNPSGGGSGNSTVDSGNYFTEDVSLKVFMDSLIEFVVRS